MAERRFVLRPEDHRQGWRIASSARDALREAAVEARDSGQPHEVVIRPHRSKRSTEQNRLQWLWLQEAEQQGDQRAEEYRAEIKLRVGIPLLRAESDHFRERYDTTIKGLDYETKLNLMAEPFDFPVTRLMSVQQMTEYLERMRQYLTVQGIALTAPDQAVEAW